MPAKKHHVTLNQEQRERVEIIARSYKHSERECCRARILGLADTNQQFYAPATCLLIRRLITYRCNVC